MRGWLFHSDRGGVTAEFAVVMPAVLVILGLVIGGVMLSAHRITLVSAAADIARLEARGDSALAGERSTELPEGVAVNREKRGGLTCVTLRSTPGGGMLSGFVVSASSCATTWQGEF